MAKKLNNAPLQEVIFELRWKVSGPEELQRFNYLHGDLYSLVKKDLKYRETLLPPEIPVELYINRPIYRFRPVKGGYPLIQIGPGILTTNTIDQDYYWEKFNTFTKDTLNNLFNVFQFPSGTNIDLALQYHDFFEFSFSNQNIYKFLKDNLHIYFNQDFFITSKNPNEISLGFSYNTEFGTFVIKINKGKNQQNKEGVIVQFKVLHRKFELEGEKIMTWVNNAHDICSDTFIKLTKGDLYNSFK
ncbi:MAG: hypothetical protein B6D61_03520 [Bacteroidetes bacterium 4484_249]|nr:MAG: hypothetical protein B6D61_03520 [Bacteroidetes bacterium 4484_249]